MAKSVVVLVPCEGYEEERVYAAVREGLALLGGLEAFVRQDERVLLKPNLLNRAIAEKAVTTHPAVFAAVARCFREAGYAHLAYGDSPGSPAATPEKAAETCGIKAAAERLGIEPADFSTVSPVHFPQGRVCRSFMLCRGVREADALINLAKMKTHALERITGAVKNLYGCVCGANKAAGHVHHPDSYVFADMLCDLHRCVKPRLHILDGIVAMEGNGPTSGVPTPMNVLLFSADPVALDSVFAALVYLDPAEVPTCVSGAREGLGVMAAADILVRTPAGELSVADCAARYGRPGFDVYRGTLKKNLLSKLTPLLPFLQERPVADPKKCIACGLCEESCPVPGKAVHAGHGQKARYDYAKCIRCFCCQEMCPARAISVHRSGLNRLLGRR